MHGILLRTKSIKNTYPIFSWLQVFMPSIYRLLKRCRPYTTSGISSWYFSGIFFLFSCLKQQFCTHVNRLGTIFRATITGSWCQMFPKRDGLIPPLKQYPAFPPSLAKNEREKNQGSGQATAMPQRLQEEVFKKNDGSWAPGSVPPAGMVTDTKTYPGCHLLEVRTPT